MKKLDFQKLYFLIAIFACFDLATATRIANAFAPQNDESIEATIDELGDEVGDALEQLAESLGESADQLGEHFEEWAEEHAEELDDWSAKYAQKWESWANGLERKMEEFAGDQEGIWADWASDYEQKWDRWAGQLESKDIDAEAIGELVERNLKMLSEMPLGQMVDQVLKDGVGELSDAPWESLGELSELAKSALQEPLDEFAQMTEQGSQERRAIDRSVRDLQRTLGKLADEAEGQMRQIGESEDRFDEEGEGVDQAEDELSRSRVEIQAKTRALKKLLAREDLSDKQRQRLESLLATLRDTDVMLKAKPDDRRRDNSRSRSDARPQRDSRRDDQRKQRGEPGRSTRSGGERDIRARMDEEKRRHQETINQFNQDLRRSSEESRRAEDKRRETESRRDKRVDGKDLDPDSKKQAEKKALRWLTGKQGDRGIGDDSSKKANSKKRAGGQNKSEEKSEVELLRQEIEMLRKEIRKMKSGK